MSEQINLDTAVLDVLDGTQKRKYFIARHCPALDQIGVGNDLELLWNMYGVTVFSIKEEVVREVYSCLLYTSPSPRDRQKSRMPSSA